MSSKSSVKNIKKSRFTLHLVKIQLIFLSISFSYKFQIKIKTYDGFINRNSVGWCFLSNLRSRRASVGKILNFVDIFHLKSYNFMFQPKFCASQFSEEFFLLFRLKIAALFLLGNNKKQFPLD